MTIEELMRDAPQPIRTRIVNFLAKEAAVETTDDLLVYLTKEHEERWKNRPPYLRIVQLPNCGQKSAKALWAAIEPHLIKPADDPPSSEQLAENASDLFSALEQAVIKFQLHGIPCQEFKSVLAKTRGAA